jgi:hypothetical protein
VKPYVPVQPNNNLVRPNQVPLVQPIPNNNINRPFETYGNGYQQFPGYPSNQFSPQQYPPNYPSYPNQYPPPYPGYPPNAYGQSAPVNPNGYQQQKTGGGKMNMLMSAMNALQKNGKK